MARCEKQTFPDFTEECIEALRRKIQAGGGDQPTLPAGTTSGTASRLGFAIAWTYDPAGKTLTVECTDSPFYAPCTVINAQIRSWITACYPANQDDGLTSPS